MANMAKLKNLKSVQKQLKAAQDKHAAGYERGAKKAGLVIQRQSQLIVPVDVGNLKASAFTRHTGRGFTTQVIVGYTAAYAIFVHENLDVAHGEEYNRKYSQQIKDRDKYWYYDYVKNEWFQQTYHERGPDQQAKFLEAVVRKHRLDVVQIVMWEMRKDW